MSYLQMKSATQQERFIYVNMEFFYPARTME